MESKTASTAYPYLRSCLEETDTPCEGDLTGEIPRWLKGNLIRIGSGRLYVGPDRYNHLFDGLALMHRFCFEDGKVKYQNKFLKSDTYRRNMKANRILVSEFATTGVPDPCKTIFQRFSSLFQSDDLTDNDLVNVILYADEPYACSETNSIWKIDPETLESIEKVKLDKYVPVNAATAHAHEDKDGTVYNIGSTFTFYPLYKILKFPPKGKTNESTFERSSVVSSIPGSRNFNVSYHHSFGMTGNYFIFVEQPLYLNVPKMAWNHFFGKPGSSFAEAMHWDENLKSRFHVVRRSDGKVLDTVYLAQSFFVFHHINAYEDEQNLVVDMCTHKNGTIVKNLYVKALEEMFNQSEGKPFSGFDSKAERYVLPLNFEKEKKGENLVTLSNSGATAVLQEDNSVLCSPEELAGGWGPELPRINYEKYNGSKYKFFYAMAKNKENEKIHLIKGNVEDKATLSWFEEGVIPSEPVFISNPDSQQNDEDSGILLASLLYVNDEKKVSLLVLDAKSMKELGRVTFVTSSSIPGDFHGTFVRKA